MHINLEWNKIEIRETGTGWQILFKRRRIVLETALDNVDPVKPQDMEAGGLALWHNPQDTEILIKTSLSIEIREILHKKWTFSPSPAGILRT